MNKNLKILFSIGQLVLVVVLLFGKWGPLPRIGSFFSPQSGWMNQNKTENQEIPKELKKLLKGKVTVHFDSLGVPYIFADVEEDVYRMQGYITARDRLFQMEAASRLTAGRLAEWMGAGMIENDKYFRRLGLSEAAKRATDLALSDPETKIALESYAEGVNLFISNLKKEDYPLEYKLLDVEPELWTPEKSILILKNITYTLTGYFDDYQKTNARNILGIEFIKEILFKDFDEINPIISKSYKGENQVKALFDLETYYRAKGDLNREFESSDPANGSNNWALRASKTKNGKPILSSDPHLTMSLPSIWYEQSLNTTDFSAHGVIIPGSPGICIGFTPFMSWGVTNSGADVADFFELTFKDESLNEYFHDGKWKPITRKIETIIVKDSNPVIDTVLYSHHGPILATSIENKRSNIPVGSALRWIAHDEGNELKALIGMMKAKNVKEYTNSLERFKAPALNWAFASSSDSIGMWVNGKLPKKWNYQGAFISDGSDSRYEWKEYIPFDELPHEINPERNFVSSANQIPTDSYYPYYFDYKMAGFSRPNRVNQILASRNDITVKEIQEMQLDSYSLLAEKMLPIYLSMLEENRLPESLLSFKKMLEQWNFTNEGDSQLPTLFHEWRKQIHDNTWDEISSSKIILSKPSPDNTDLLIINKPESKWFDDLRTDSVEYAKDIVIKSFGDAVNRLEKLFGSISTKWKLQDYNRTDLRHLAGISGFGSGFVATNGYSESINAIRGNHGPSWRMVVEMDGWNTRALVTYPGGQSGNPGSKHYTDRLENWRINTGSEVKLYKTSKNFKNAVYSWEF